MHILCPKCSTKFIITESQIVDTGRKVRCSKCKHIWHAQLSQADEISNTVQKQDNTDNISTSNATAKQANESAPAHLPAIIPVEKHITYKDNSSLLLIGMIMLTFTMLFASKFGYETFFKNRDVTIENLTIQKNDNTKKITLKYKVYNAAEHATKMPLLKIQLMDSRQRVLKTKIVDNSTVKLHPNKCVWITTDILHAPTGIENVKVIIGNRLDFLLN